MATSHMHLLISSFPIYKPLIKLSPKPIKIHQNLSIKSSQLNTKTTMQEQEEILHDYSPFLRIYKTGRVERLKGSQITPPSLDPITKVISKDVAYSPELGLSCRVYVPESYLNTNQKRPLLVYFHGGGFCVETPFSPVYHNHLNKLVAEANCVVVSVGYRRAPEHPVPAAYDDAWTSLKWVASHRNGDGTDDWLNRFVDFEQVFVAGDSAGANIAHQVCIRKGQETDLNLKFSGLILVHPYFWGNEPIGNEETDLEKRKVAAAVWFFACPNSINGCDNPWINPLLDPNLVNLGCKNVLVIVAEGDGLRDRGLGYYEKLKSCGWSGDVEILEIKEEGHVFHLEKSDCDNAVLMVNRICSFINHKD